jgi:hypothetical protein
VKLLLLLVLLADSNKVEQLLQQLAAVPPEAEADGLLSLIEKGHIPEKDVPELLERAFGVANSIQASAPFYAAIRSYDSLGESVPALTAFASHTVGNRLGIQLRVVRALVAKDLSAALRYFEQIRPGIAVVNCQTELLPDTSEYFRTAVRLFHAMERSAIQRHREDATVWLTRHLALRSETEMPAVADAIQSLAERQELHSRLMSRFVQDIAALEPSFRFYWVSRKRADRLPSAGYATYQRAALQAERCADIAQAEIDQHIAGNEELAKLRPRSLDTKLAKAMMFREDSIYEQFTPLYQDLRFGPLENRRKVASQRREDGLTSFLPMEERRSPRWQAAAEVYLRKVNDYAKLDVKDADATFLKVSTLYGSLIEIAPVSSPFLNAAVGSYLAYMSGSAMLKERPDLWLAQFRMFLRRGTLDDHESGMKLIRKLIRERGNHVMNTLVDLDEFHPQVGVL